ncbi:hypothetical protein NF700_04430 [Sphingomonadaceae bacterium OTU29MARTA1]|uniref:hypothetical protein n=1 Tax=Sphingomonas sp. Leaf37 TaxID=2876552 RepID=UPI001E317A17|nr:hypothetical protein [Sphingomonas sp. Leaf37]USU06059.1 hypothetical protein NF699_05100 [Sphingomonadaceae bacterium OTU29LAMAA1]USU09542.1 hypothetical protein NF700_04430 [Sphingomonadaceae bacterium OTU29MARTA1]
MNWDGPSFVIALVLISTVGWIINNWIRARHGYAPSDDWGKTLKRDPDGEREMLALSNENDRLTGQVSHLEERIAVLERIATDPAGRTAREIEALRDR